jgi:hypothetical protein
MAAATSILKKIKPGSTMPEEDDIVVGLPLETGNRTIYPVFRDSTTPGAVGAGPRQIGYLEVSEDRSDYTSLEPDRRPLAVFPILLAIVIVIWLFRRIR